MSRKKENFKKSRILVVLDAINNKDYFNVFVLKATHSHVDILYVLSNLFTTNNKYV